MTASAALIGAAAAFIPAVRSIREPSGADPLTAPDRGAGEPDEPGPVPEQGTGGHYSSSAFALGAVSCALAAALVISVGITRISLSQPLIVVLGMGTVLSAAAATRAGVRLLGASIRTGRPDLAGYAVAGLLMAAASVVAALVAGTG